MAVNETELLERITINPQIFGGKPIIRGRRLAVEHILGMLAAGDSPETILEGYDWLEPEDIEACLLFADPDCGLELRDDGVESLEAYLASSRSGDDVDDVFHIYIQ